MIEYQMSPAITNPQLNALFSSVRENHQEVDFVAQLERCLFWVCAYKEQQLVGFVKVAWDGGKHGFVLDTTTHPHYQRQGVGHKLLKHAIEIAKQKGLKWLHADFESHLLGFYRQAGFRHTESGLIDLIHI